MKTSNLNFDASSALARALHGSCRAWFGVALCLLALSPFCVLAAVVDRIPHGYSADALTMSGLLSTHCVATAAALAPLDKSCDPETVLDPMAANVVAESPSGHFWPSQFRPLDVLVEDASPNFRSLDLEFATERSGPDRVPLQMTVGPLSLADALRIEYLKSMEEPEWMSTAKDIHQSIKGLGSSWLGHSAGPSAEEILDRRIAMEGAQAARINAQEHKEFLNLRERVIEFVTQNPLAVLLAGVLGLVGIVVSLRD